MKLENVQEVVNLAPQHILGSTIVSQASLLFFNSDYRVRHCLWMIILKMIIAVEEHRLGFNDTSSAIACVLCKVASTQTLPACVLSMHVL